MTTFTKAAMPNAQVSIDLSKKFHQALDQVLEQVADVDGTMGQVTLKKHFNPERPEPEYVTAMVSVRVVKSFFAEA